MITLTAGTATTQIAPEMGAGLVGVWAGGLPVLRPWSGRAEEGPFALGCNLLLPFSNRISTGGFTFDGDRHLVPPNLPPEPCAIHGDAFQRAWTVQSASPDRARLTLPDGAMGPFRYEATVTYQLTDSALTTDLSVTNRADRPLPYGLGFHPWFPRDAATRLSFTATGHWPEDAHHLPVTTEPLPLPDDGQWLTSAPLPSGWINTGFSGWSGPARITQGQGAASVILTARNLDVALLYSPSATAGFFCFEPVSHPVDAHNLPGQPGLVRLSPSETLTASMTLTWGPLAA